MPGIWENIVIWLKNSPGRLYFFRVASALLKMVMGEGSKEAVMKKK